jgi:3-methylfumaryl-CoA hydratase
MKKPTGRSEGGRGGASQETTEAKRSELVATDERNDWSYQRRYDEVAVGDEVPPFSMWLSYQLIVMSIAVDRMFSGIHHNRDQARASGFGDIIFNTRSYEMLFETMLRRWMGLDGRLQKLGPFRMTGSSYPDDIVTARAHVLEKVQRDNKRIIKVEISALNNRGEAARGEAEVVLPL